MKIKINTVLRWSNVGLRGLMEIAIVIGMAFCGYKFGNQGIWKIIFAILFPLAGFGFWSIVDFHRLKKHGEMLRLIEELLITGLVAAILYGLGAHLAGWTLAILSVIHHSLTYILGERLHKTGID